LHQIWCKRIIGIEIKEDHSMLRYPRPALAEEFAAALQGKTFFNDAHHGLFLAAPRRTGKSTFLRADLKPALERAGAVVVYVDLWADRRGDPCALIAEAIGQALRARRGFLAKAAEKMGWEISFWWVGGTSTSAKSARPTA
jgi:hypothetical protein